MCGITGFYQTEALHGPVKMHALGKAMCDTLESRGPDGQGYWQDPDIALFFAHRRLSIIDLSEQGAQPMESASGRYIITYNGEIYNFQKLSAELESAGVQFRGRSDTEVMLAAFERWGVNQALQKLNGMFSFALWDKKLRQIHFCKDRLGKKPLYIGWAGKSLVFGSELKALRAYPEFKPKINRDSLCLYMRYGCLTAPHTIYDDVWQLPAGCRVCLDLDKLEPGYNLSNKFESYWKHSVIADEARSRKSVLSEKQAIEEFEHILTEAVRTRMISDVPLGSFLSGGIDSSLVSALMQSLSPSPIKTFCIGFDEDGFDEAAHAKSVAKHLGTEHNELYLGPKEAMDVIPSLSQIYDEPFSDISQIPTYIVSRFARQQVTVALSGDGGDEMFGGYLRHYIVPNFWKRFGWMPLALRYPMARAITCVSTERWSEMVPQQPQFGERIYKIAELLQQKNAGHVYRHLVSQFSDPMSIVHGGNEPLVSLFDESDQPKGLNFAEKMMFGDALSYLPNDILTKVDRASMACSLEVRAPLLDKNIFDYAWSLPLKMKIRKNNGSYQGKWLLREVLKRYVPSDMFDRPKQGFTVPIGSWLRDPLKDWAEDLLDRKRLQNEGYFEPELIRALWDDHLQGKGRNAHKLWTVLMFQSWLERWG